MSVERIAGRYALTLISAAKEQGQVEKVYEDANTFRQAMNDSRELVLLLESPIVRGDKKFKALSTIFQDHIGELFLSFLKVICKKGRESYMKEIIRAFREEYKKLKGITEVEVVTASEIDDATLNKIKDKIKSLPHVRKELIIEHHIDPELIGGFVVRYEDKVYDASVAHELENIRRQIAG